MIVMSEEAQARLAVVLISMRQRLHRSPQDVVQGFQPGMLTLKR